MRLLLLSAAVAALVAVAGALLTYAWIARPGLAAARASSADLLRAQARIAELEAALARCELARP
jgi:hypothetical protein